MLGMVKKAHFENGPGILVLFKDQRRCPFPLSLLNADTYSTGNYNFIGNYEDETNTAILCNCGQFVSRSRPVNRNVLAEFLLELFPPLSLARHAGTIYLCCAFLFTKYFPVFFCKMEKCQSVDISKGQGNAALQAEMIDQKQRQS